MRIHIFQFFARLNVAKYVLKNCKIELINPLQNKPNTAKTKKHPLKVKNYPPKINFLTNVKT